MHQNGGEMVGRKWEKFRNVLGEGIVSETYSKKDFLYLVASLEDLQEAATSVRGGFVRHRTSRLSEIPGNGCLWLR